MHVGSLSTRRRSCDFTTYNYRLKGSQSLLVKIEKQLVGNAVIQELPFKQNITQPHSALAMTRK